MSSGATELGPGSGLDTTVPHSARMWNYYLGGKDNFAIDRAVADQVIEVYPGILDIAQQSRAFLGRAVRHLAGEAGIRQFLDIGTGLPTAENTHEVAQRVAPSCRIVYVDNDPMVLVHARALLTSGPEGVTAYIDADVRDPEKVLAAAAQTLDFSKPVGLMMLGIMGAVLDDDEAYGIMRRLLAELVPGSFLVLEDGTSIIRPEAAAEAERRRAEAERRRAEAGDPYRLRDPEHFGRFFDGLELLEPGVVCVSRWRPESTSTRPPAEVDALGAVGRKP